MKKNSENHFNQNRNKSNFKKSSENNFENGYTDDFSSNSQKEKKYLEALEKARQIMKEEEEKNRSIFPPSPLTISMTQESTSVYYDSVQKLWGMVTIQAAHSSTRIDAIDFVVVIDQSASMKEDKKMAYVIATIKYMIGELNSQHRFCLIRFNHEVNFVTNGLLSMTQENKQKILDLLNDIKPEGSTNLSDALFHAITILKQRDQEASRISSVMLFTDGLATVGLRGKSLLDYLKMLDVPPGLTIHTFGYGTDHDSSVLQEVSFLSKGGVYHYIENSESIPALFGECFAGLLSTVAHNIEIQLLGQDGCRIVNFYTKFPIHELKAVKDYNVSLGSMYSEESKSVLFKLSLRKLSQPSIQNLIKVIITYTNSLTGDTEHFEDMIKLKRSEEPIKGQKIPSLLDKHINRFTAAAAIEEAVKLASAKDFMEAQKKIQEVIEVVKRSASAQDLKYSSYCEDLIEDLKECAEGMENYESFISGVHYAHAYSTMYYLERSNGSLNLSGLKENQKRTKRKRNIGYGYKTKIQEQQSTKAIVDTKGYVNGYLELYS